MIAEAGLRLVFVQDASDTRTAQAHMFYLGIMRAVRRGPGLGAGLNRSGSRNALAGPHFRCYPLDPPPLKSGVHCVSWRSMPECTTPPPRHSTTMR